MPKHHPKCSCDCEPIATIIIAGFVSIITAGFATSVIIAGFVTITITA